MGWIAFTVLGYLLGDQLHRHARSTIVISRRDYHNLADLQKMADSIFNGIKRYFASNPPLARDVIAKTE